MYSRCNEAPNGRGRNIMYYVICLDIFLAWECVFLFVVGTYNVFLLCVVVILWRESSYRESRHVKVIMCAQYKSDEASEAC